MQDFLKELTCPINHSRSLMPLYHGQSRRAKSFVETRMSIKLFLINILLKCFASWTGVAIVTRLRIKKFDSSRSHLSHRFQWKFVETSYEYESFNPPQVTRTPIYSLIRVCYRDRKPIDQEDNGQKTSSKWHTAQQLWAWIPTGVTWGGHPVHSRWLIDLYSTQRPLPIICSLALQTN